MTIKTVGFILLSVAILTFSAEILASGGTLKLKGKISNGSCDVRVSSEAGSFHNPRMIQVSPRITLALDINSYACKGDVVVFRSHFEAVAGDDKPVVGVVTLTYQ
jgi:type 1 fimbria pilin